MEEVLEKLRELREYAEERSVEDRIDFDEYRSVTMRELDYVINKLTETNEEIS